MTETALQNIRVVDMTEAMAGPYAAMMLGDLGADVIKIERPGKGDMARGWGPPFVEGESGYFLSANRNKRSLTLDLKHAQGREIFQKMIAQADILLINQPRLDSLRRLGADYETLSAINPRLIYCAISGYGHTGPYAGRSGYDLAAQAESGTMALTGDPGGPAIRYPVPISDITAGLYTTISAMTALYVREQTGRGQFIDTALLDSQITWLTNLAGAYFVSGERPRKLGQYHPQIAPYEPFDAADKSFVVAVGSERLWQNMCETLGIADTIGADPRYAANADRLAHRMDLHNALNDLFAANTADHWLEKLREVGIPCGAINEVDEILADSHVIARGMVVEQEHPVVGAVRSLGNPMHLSATPPSYRLPPPTLGQHTDEILAELGYDAAAVAALHAGGAV
ncbi:MAG: CoA transferase [Caldilineales bacterium]|nr:CoA transferase [Caldilineales bacterium]